MNGCEVHSRAFFNKDIANSTMYNNWNFTSEKEWDGLNDKSFWYSSKSNLLYTTENYKIGSSGPGQI